MRFPSIQVIYSIKLHVMNTATLRFLDSPLIDDFLINLEGNFLAIKESINNSYMITSQLSEQ